MENYEDVKARALSLWRSKAPNLLLMAKEHREAYIAAVLIEFSATEIKRVLETLR